MKIRKAVFPVAGLGTRVLPATKAMPKEMLTIVDKPLIQYVYDEAREAGIEHFIFVTGRNKSVIEDHFDRMYELDATLAARGKKAEQDILAQNQPEAGAVSFTRQQAPLGLGHAVWCARDIVGNEPFAVVLPDELVLNSPGCLKQMIETASTLGENRKLGLLVAALLERALQFVLQVEVVFDHALVASGDHDEMLDAGRARFVDHMLDQWAIDDRQHFLRHRLGGGQEPGTESRNGENGLANGFHEICFVLVELSQVAGLTGVY